MSDADEPSEGASGESSPAEPSDPAAEGAPAASPESGLAEASGGPLASAEDAARRQDWHEGPDEDAPPESWLGLHDDDLLHRIETAEEGSDDRLMEVVESERHFFVRQEAAKRVRDRSPLFRFEDDRHIGPILVRHLTRREDVTYLERLVERSHHVEVRASAQIQLARLWGRLGGPTRTSPSGSAVLPPPEFREAPSAASLGPEAPGEAGRVEGGATPAEAEDEGDHVDTSLLGWALHFVVEAAWEHLGTTTTRGILRRTHAELLPANDSLGAFRVEDDAHVAVDLRRGARLSRHAVDGVARWLVAFLDAASRSSDGVGRIDLRSVTRLMGDALDGVGFYEAVAAAWSVKR